MAATSGSSCPWEPAEVERPLSNPSAVSGQRMLCDLSAQLKESVPVMCVL
jgi:hypothetical protein